MRNVMLYTAFMYFHGLASIWCIEVAITYCSFVSRAVPNWECILGVFFLKIE